MKEVEKCVKLLLKVILHLYQLILKPEANFLFIPFEVQNWGRVETEEPGEGGSLWLCALSGVDG